MCGLAAATVKVPGGRQRWLMAAVACASTIYFSTSRAFIVVALAAALAAFLLGGAKVNRRWLAITVGAVVIVTLAVFTGLGAVLGKTYGNSTIGEFDNFFSRHQVARPLALPYQDATASIPALDLLTRVSTTWGVAHGCATAPIACGVLRKLGVPTLRVPAAGPYTKDPLRWNGYTFLDRFLIDFGTALALVLVAITGAVAGYWWRRAREGSVASIVLYAISVPGLVAAYRQNLIEIVLVSSVIAVGLLMLCSAVAATAFLPHAKVRGLRWVNALLQPLKVAPAERVQVAGPVANAAAVANTSVRQVKLFGLRRMNLLRRRRTRPPAERVEVAGRALKATAVATAGLSHAELPAPGGKPLRQRRSAAPATVPERVDVAGRVSKTKEECEHYARYVWASRLVHGSILDVACGTGYGSRLLARSGRVTGVDRDQGAVEQARSRARGTFLVAEVPPIPIRAQAFDFVVCFETIEHVHDDVEFMREIRRVLGSRGKLLLSTPNAYVSGERGMPVNPWHVREHTWESLTTLLESAGLEIIDRYMQSFPPLFSRGHRFTWRLYGLTWVLLPRPVRTVIRPLLGDAQVRPFKTRSRAPAYWVVSAAARGARRR
jgi:SAM-dependent methyltransferase